MKKLIISSALGLLLSCSVAPAQDLKIEEKIKKEFDMSNLKTLSIHNLSGFIKVEGYAGSKIMLEIDQTISAENQAEFQKGKDQFELGFDQNTDSLIVYIKEPWDSRPNSHKNDWNKKERVDYHYHLDFTVKVPYAMNLNVSTVNNGNISIANVAGSLKINNVNGAIALENIKGKTSVRTVNGNVDVSYAENPPGDSDYYTLNGDLTITYPANLSADCEYKSFNGELFTDFPEVQILPARISQNTNKHGGSTKYKLQSNTLFQIGKGGKNLHFETFNGNIYIKKQS